jgi:hypothetical protein
MKNEHQLGSDQDWLQYSNEELARIIKKRDRRIAFLRFLLLLLLIALGWVVYKFTQKGAIEELWKF